MGTLTTMKFDSSCTMHEHVIEITNIVTRLKSLGKNVDENFLVQFIINSLRSEYGLFQMNYNTMKDKWNMHELHNMLVQKETRLKNQGIHFIHFVSHQGTGKTIEKKHVKGKQGPVKINKSSTKILKKEHKDGKCRFCGKLGHFRKDCLKRKAWFKKKGKPSSIVCFESNLTEVLYNIWWIDSSCTAHICKTLEFMKLYMVSKLEV